MSMFALAVAFAGIQQNPPQISRRPEFFIQPPYLQLGPNDQTKSQGISIVWHAKLDNAKWRVAVSPVGVQNSTSAVPSQQEIKLGVMPDFRVMRAGFDGLMPGVRHRYTVFRNEKTVFNSDFEAPKARNMPTRAVIFGDCGRNTSGQRRIAFQAFKAKPDFALITGDIVYAKGTHREYATNFWPVYNNVVASPTIGVPMMRQTLFVGVTGNHDTAYRSLSNTPDGLAYYTYWRQPAPGPAFHRLPPGFKRLGFKTDKSALGNFGFAYGDAYWIVLDANTYVNWKNPKLRSWLESELKTAENYRWKFVSYHQPAYHSSKKKENEIYMRVLSDMFTAYNVDIVFNGHVHNYQRTYPMRTKANGQQWELDRLWNGKTETKARGTIYMVNGAGGAELYDQRMADKPSVWKPFTVAYKKGFSFSVLDYNRNALWLRQLDPDGKTIDEFRLK